MNDKVTNNVNDMIKEGFESIKKSHNDYKMYKWVLMLIILVLLLSVIAFVISVYFRDDNSICAGCNRNEYLILNISFLLFVSITLWGTFTLLFKIFKSEGEVNTKILEKQLELFKETQMWELTKQKKPFEFDLEKQKKLFELDLEKQKKQFEPELEKQGKR